jgi:hypothetical protein
VALYVATGDYIEDMQFGRRSLPKPAVMVSQLDKVEELKGKLELKLFMDGPGKILHKYVHGDMEQLRRRFGNSGTFTHEEKQLQELLAADEIVSDLFLLLGGTLYSVTAPWTKIANIVEPESNAVVDEIRKRTDQLLAEWQGWKELPFPAISLGRIPEELRGSRFIGINSGSAPERTKNRQVNS